MKDETRMKDEMKNETRKKDETREKDETRKRRMWVEYLKGECRSMTSSSSLYNTVDGSNPSGLEPLLEQKYLRPR